MYYFTSVTWISQTFTNQSSALKVKLLLSLPL